MAKFVRAYGAGDVDTLVGLLTDDVRLSMPPIPLEYHGRDAVSRFYASVITHRRYDLVPTRANGQVAFGTYLYAPTDGIRHGTGLLVLTLTGGPDLRPDPLRQQRPSVVRPAAIPAWQLTRDAVLRLRPSRGQPREWWVAEANFGSATHMPSG